MNETVSLLIKGLVVMISSFVGTFGFAILLQAPRRAWFPASAIGAVAYALSFVLIQLGISQMLAIFLSALLGSVAAQYCARKMRMIATIFITLSIVAQVPGLGLYRCMELLARQQNSAAAAAGVEAMASILMIALGLGVGAFLFRILFTPRPHRA